MRYRIAYFLRETWINIRSNLTFSFAAILTIAVMTTLVGSAILAQYAVDNATKQFQDGVDLIIYLDPDIGSDEFETIRVAVDTHQDIDRWVYFDRQQSYAEALEILSDTDDVDIASLRPEDVPTSFRVVPRIADAGLIESLTSQFDARPGVFLIVSEQEAVEAFTSLFERFRVVVLVLAIGLVVAAILLIYNGIRVAMFARRREVEVQKLVGATNWFIRFPFVLEGMFHGLIGALIGSAGLWLLRDQVEGLFSDDRLAAFSEFKASDGELQFAVYVVLAAGTLIGGLGSAFAAGRYLDV
jgi:cell division transport system permease protein